MKNLHKALGKKIILASSIALLSIAGYAQKKVAVSNFTKIIVPANFEIKIIQSETNQISFQKEDTKTMQSSLIEKGAKVTDNTLSFTLTEFENSIPVLLNVYTNNLQEIKLESNAQISMGTDSALKAKNLKIYADGATKLELFVEVESLEAKINGASKLILDGKAGEGKLEATGASRINAIGTAFENLNAEASGASKVVATVKNNLKAEASGFSKIQYAGNPKNVEKEATGGSKVEQVNADDVDDDKRSVSAGISMNKGKKHRNKKHSTEMESAFGGIEIGVSSLVTPNFNTTLVPSNKNLETNIGSSWRFAINLGDADLQIVKGRIALTSGLGFSFDQYGFKNKNLKINDNANQLNFDTVSTLSTNRLSQVNLTLPLLIKYNSKYNNKDKRFYVATGVIVNYTLSNSIYTEYSKNGVDYENRARGEFFVNRLRADATARLGYGALSVFLNYGLVPLFETAKVADTRTAQVGLALNF